MRNGNREVAFLLTYIENIASRSTYLRNHSYFRGFVTELSQIILSITNRVFHESASFIGNNLKVRRTNAYRGLGHKPKLRGANFEKTTVRVSRQPQIAL